MKDHTLIFGLSALLIAILYFGIAGYALRHRHIPGARALAALMLGAAGYAIPYILQLASLNLKQALLWYNISLAGASILGPAWLAFTLQYTGKRVFLTRRENLLLVAIPALTCLVAWTNPLHGLYGSNFRFDPQALWPALEWDFGLFYWVNFIYAYSVTAIGTLILIRAAWRQFRIYTYQTIALLAGAFIPIGINIIFAMGYSPIPKLDIAPFAFVFTGLAWSLAIFRFRFLDIVPVARELVIETMPIGVVVIDAQNRVVDANPAALKMLALPSAGLIGRNLSQFIRFTPPADLSPGEFYGEIAVGSGESGRELYWHITPLLNRNGQPTGGLILLEDITQRKQTEQAEREQRTLAEALVDTAEALNSTLLLEEVLDRILDNLGKVLPHDAAHILLLDSDNGQASVHRARGHDLSRYGDDLLIEHSVYRETSLRQMFESKQPLVVPETAQASEWQVCPARRWVRSFIGAPILVRGQVIGFLNVDSAKSGSFSEKHFERLHAFADQAALAIENARLYAELSCLALEDILTGALNRRGLLEQAQREVERAGRFDHPLGIILFDLDHFKQVNDRYGHPTGDIVLRKVTDCCRANIRQVDVLGRYGGEEFVVLLPESDLTVTCQAGERLRRSVEELHIPTDSGPIPMTISVGVTAMQGETLPIDELLDRADQALYAAKQAGRNCVRSFVAEAAMH